MRGVILLFVLSQLVLPQSIKPAAELETINRQPVPIVCIDPVNAHKQFYIHQAHLSVRQAIWHTKLEEFSSMQTGCARRAFPFPMHLYINSAKVVVNGLVVQTALWQAEDVVDKKTIYVIVDRLSGERDI